MITPSYARTMAAYNTEMNRRLYDGAARLTDAQRKEDVGAFWKSLHGTLSHLLWGDTQWMSRFAGWDKPPVPIKQSGGMVEDFNALRTRRIQADAGIEAWAGGLTEDWIDADLAWFSGALQQDMRMQRGVLVAHFFNHQTHHRGQAHHLLTARGIETGDTDMAFILSDLPR